MKIEELIGKAISGYEFKQWSVSLGMEEPEVDEDDTRIFWIFARDGVEVRANPGTGSIESIYLRVGNLNTEFLLSDPEEHKFP